MTSRRGVVRALAVVATLAPAAGLAQPAPGGSGAHDPRVRVVRAPDGGSARIEVSAPGRAPVVAWQGSTRWVGEDVGDRVRDEVVERDGVAVVRWRESPRLCGVGAFAAEVRRVDPATGALARVASVEPWGFEAPAASGAARVEGVAAGAAPVFAPRNALASSGDVRALFDQNPATAWRPDAQGFATVTLPSSAFSLRAIDLTPASPSPVRRWTVLVEPGPRRYDFELPAAPLAAGRVWRVTLPEPAAARCVSLVPRATSPSGAAAGVALRSTLDDGPDAVPALVRAVDGADGDNAASLLVATGPAGVRALAEALPRMGVAGARRTLRVLGGQRAPEALSAVVAALARDEVSEQAAEALRQTGAPALDALASAVASDARALAVIASMRAPIDVRLRAAAPALATRGAPWAASRGPLGELLAEAARARAVEPWLAALPDDPTARARGLRMASDALADDDPLRARVAAEARALWAARDDFEQRYRILPALAGDAEGVGLVAAALAGDDDDLRAEAARVLARVPASTAALTAALSDRVPRVRAAAARALAGRPAALGALLAALANDRWPSVRVEAATSVAREPGATAGLLAALDARSVGVVRAAITALALNPGAGVTPRLAAFADDGRREPTLRRDAAEALGLRCDRSAANDLERLVESLSDGALPPWEQEIGHAALAALARLDAARARAFLTRNQSNAEAASAVDRAARQGCAASR